MKIALVTRRFPPQIGGIERVCSELATGLAAAGDDVVVYSHRPFRSRLSETNSGFEVRRVASTGSDLDISPTLIRELRRERFDVWHAHHMHSYAPLAVWMSKCRPFVVTTHQHDAGRTGFTTCLHSAYRPLASRALAAAACVTSVSAFEAELVKTRYGVTPIVVPNGVHLASFRALARKPNAAREAVIVGRLHPYKRVDLAIHAMALLGDEHRLTIIGDGPQRNELEQLTRDLQLQHRVTVRSGASDDEVRVRVRNAEVSLALSQHEAFSLSVLESLAAGTPVLAVRDGALAEWVGRFPEAVTAIQPTPTALADALTASHQRHDDLDLSQFDWPRVVSRMRTIYERSAGL
jgi:glycosyltransferase involved in cell wall biosynthesis